MPTALGESNGYVPSHEGSNRLMVNFSRNPKKFAVNRYIQVTPVSQDTGYYLKMDVEAAGRIRDDDSDIDWPDGAPAPDGSHNQREFEFPLFKTRRRALPWTLGDKGAKQATFDAQQAHSDANAQNMMTRRTNQVISVATDVANHEPGHVIDVSALGGTATPWAESTTQRGTIKKSIHTLREQIMDATLAAVEETEFCLVINGIMASEISQSQEIVDLIKGSTLAAEEIKGTLASTNPNSLYGLPRHLYGMKLEVEITRKVTSKRGQARTVQQVLNRGTPFVTARPGSLEGNYGSPSFSGITLFAFEDMKVETFRDRKNRRTEGRVVDDYVPVMTAPAACGMFINA